ncbi:MAG TPA: hypothetical protein VJB15_12895, partial [Rhodothermia bacterium]|nr:hypothetical protein [Rhodothermia bacterium]
IGATVSIAAYVALIPTLGVAGAAIGTSTAYIVIAVASNQMFKRSISPVKARLFRTRWADITWATHLIRDSLGIWGRALRRS